jgi:hypothetical protein
LKDSFGTLSVLMGAFMASMPESRGVQPWLKDVDTGAWGEEAEAKSECLVLRGLAKEKCYVPTGNVLPGRSRPDPDGWELAAAKTGAAHHAKLLTSASSGGNLSLDTEDVHHPCRRDYLAERAAPRRGRYQPTSAAMGHGDLR